MFERYFFDLAILEPMNAEQQTLSDEVITRWSSFARTGDPNVRGAKYWPRAAPLDRQVQSLNPAGSTRTDFITDHRIAFWR